MVSRFTTSPSTLPIDAHDCADAAAVPPAALNVKQVASLLGVSIRHVYRMADGGLMPRPIKLGGLNHWHRAVIENWLADGVHPVR